MRKTKILFSTIGMCLAILLSGCSLFNSSISDSSVSSITSEISSSDTSGSNSVSSSDSGNDSPSEPPSPITFKNKKYNTVSSAENSNGYTLTKSYKDTTGNCYYLFYLGRILDVPLTSDYFYRKYDGIDYNIELKVVYATEESIKTEILKAGQKTTTVNENMTGSVGFDIGTGKDSPVNFQAHLSYEWGKTWGSSSSSSWSQTYSDAVTKSCEESASVSINFNSAYPHGYYRYMFFGVLDVYAYVVKNVNHNMYYYDTINSIVSKGYAWDFAELDDPTFSNNKPGKLSFDLSTVDGLGEPTTVSDFSTENGTEAKPFLINDVDDFKSITRLDGNNVYFSITNDLDFDDQPYFIGSFNGILNGNNHTIKNLKIKYPYQNERVNFGLFGINNGTISDLNIVNSSVSSYPDFANTNRISSVGMLAGFNSSFGIITNCSVNGGSVRSDSSDIAQLFEKKYSTDPRTIGNTSSGWQEWCTQSYDNHVNDGTNWKNLKLEMFTGGLVGLNEGQIIHSDYYGKVEGNLFNMYVNESIEQINYVGGIVGKNVGTIDNCLTEIEASGWIELDNNGDGYGWVGDIYPTAKCFVCGIAGVNCKSGVLTNNRCTANCFLNIGYRVYAPQYAFLSGANYSSSTKGHINNITMKKEQNCVQE